MYKLNYNKVTNKIFDVSLNEKKYFGNIEITEEDKNKIIESLNAGLDVFAVPESSTYLVKEHFCPCEKLIEIKKIRDELLEEQTFYHTEWYQEKLLLQESIEVDEAELMEYYLRIHLLETNYSNSEDKEGFLIVMVDEYSEGYEDEDALFELVKPDFIK